MNVFLTGATGYVGRHCMSELLEAGHTVSALSRRDSNPVIKGVTWVKGSLSTLKDVQADITAADVIMHCAMEYINGSEAGDLDAAAMDIFLESGKFIVSTGNLYTCSSDQNGLIDEALLSESDNWRNVAEKRLLENSAGGASIRPSFVYGGTGGYFWLVFQSNDAGKVQYCGDGNNTWPMVHVSDLARLYRLVAEQRASGIYHGWDGHNISVADMVGVACEHQGGTPEMVEHSVAHQRLGSFANHMLRTITPVSGNTAELGWSPEYPRFKEAAAKAYKDYTAHQKASAA